MSEPADATASQVYRVRARNTATASENRIHDDATAARYGFRGGLVPGVTVYGYMTVPVVERFGRAWLERGAMQIKFIQPVYEGDEVTVRAVADAASTESTDSPLSRLSLTAARGDGTICAVATATINAPHAEPRLDDYRLAPLPADDNRPAAVRESFVTGAALGTLRERLDLKDTSLLERLDERLAVYRGDEPLAHPVALLERANHLLMRNFKLGPWIHAASDLVNCSAAYDGEMIEARGRVVDCFERKGHEFVVCDVLLVAGGARVVQQVRHTAIYRPRFV
ncbi:MAG TPA: MaoC family dehydratase [Blastocatellia bacterium]|nr:MaoC family dehydratase [Blastocatellia bacterium]